MFMLQSAKMLAQKVNLLNALLQLMATMCLSPRLVTVLPVPLCHWSTVQELQSLAQPWTMPEPASPQLVRLVDLLALSKCFLVVYPSNASNLDRLNHNTCMLNINAVRS